MTKSEQAIKNEVEDAFAAARQACNAEPLSIAQRRDLLLQLKQRLLANQDAIVAAIDSDFGGRSRHETLLAEIYGSAEALSYSAKKLKAWAKPRRCPVPAAFQPAKAWLAPQPRGVVGLISPWNYPVYLTLSPVASAIAAGNRVMLKLSEFAPNTSELLVDLLNTREPGQTVFASGGGVSVGKAFAALPFDHLLFTGSVATGRTVMKSAAENLTSVTLELGGKSPAVVAPDADFKRAADSIAFGKLFNAGQTCVAPDYAFVEKSRLDDFINAFSASAASLYPSFQNNPDYTAIINQNHYQRLAALVAEAEQAGCKVMRLGRGDSEGDKKIRVFEPILIINPEDRLRVMAEEIFGPILPIITYAEPAEAIRYINQRPHPLALYLFTDDKRLVAQFVTATQSGALSVNETLVHAGIDSLPLGGVGESGIGAYHGKTGFDTFSHLKPVFERRKPNISALLRPPYGKSADRIIGFLLGR